MAGLLYTHPADDYVAVLAASTPGAITASAAALVGYEVENIGNEDPQWPFKTDATSVDIDVNLGGSVPIGVVALVHANLTAGLSPSVLQIILNGSATFQVDVPPYQEDGFPTTPLYDFEAEGDGIQTASSIRIRITGNSVPISMGELVVCPGWRDIGVDYRPNAEDDEDHPSIRNTSDGGGVNTKYSHGYRRRWLRGDVLDTTIDDDEKIRRLNRATRGDFLPILVHPRLPIMEPWYVAFEASRLPRKRVFHNIDTGLLVNGYTLNFEEVPRGLIPEPSAV